MQEVSQAWKEAHKQTLLPETFVEITLSIVDDDAANFATQASGTNMDSRSLPLRVINVPYVQNSSLIARLEHNYWRLDGSIDVVLHDGWKSLGFMSVDENPCSLTVSFSTIRNFNTPGFVIVWDDMTDGYATDFTVTAKNGKNIVASTTVTENTATTSAVDMPCTGYDTIVIEVSGWSLPQRRIYINELTVGHRLIFDKNDILHYTHEQSGDLFGTELPTNKIEFSLENSDGRWNVLNPSGLEKYLFERQSLSVRYGMDVNGTTEWIPGGIFYLSEWDMPSNQMEARFVATDGFVFMRNTDFGWSGVECTTTEKVTAFQDPDMAFQTGITWPAGTKFITTGYNYITFDANENYWINRGSVSTPTITLRDRVREALRQVSLPNNMVVNIDEMLVGIRPPYVFDKKSVPEVLQLATGAVAGRLFWDRKGNLNLIGSNSYSSDRRMVLTDYLIDSNKLYSWPEVKHSPIAKDFTWIGRNNFFPDNGIYSTTWDCYGDGDSVVVDNPLAGSHNGEYAGNVLTFAEGAWREYLYKPIITLKGDFRADPRLDLFDGVTVETQYGIVSRVVITGIKYTYNGSFHGTYTGKVYDSYYAWR